MNTAERIAKQTSYLCQHTVAMDPAPQHWLRENGVWPWLCDECSPRVSLSPRGWCRRCDGQGCNACNLTGECPGCENPRGHLSEPTPNPPSSSDR